MDHVEEEIKTSGRLIQEPALNAYVRTLACRLAGPRCSDIRVYILQVPIFNASMAPNGVLQVWSGLLLRVENEAQLAYVLGHEIGHYLRRHSVQMWRDRRLKSSLFAFINLLSGAVGIPGYGVDIAKLAAAGSLLKFSRDSEREADRIGFELTAAVGYDLREAARLWQALLQEREAADDPTPWLFFSTHPTTEERIETLKQLASEHVAVTGPGILGREEYLAAIAPWRAEWLRDELQQRRFASSQVLLDRLLAGGAGLGELYFFQGELYRLQG